MNILICSDNFYPEVSGIVDSIVTTGQELARRGHKIRYCVPRYAPQNYKVANKPEQDPDFGPNITIDRLFSIYGPTGNKQGRIVIPSLSYWKRAAAFKPDIIHTQLFVGVGIQALLLHKKLKVPLIGTNHTAISEFVSPILEKPMLGYVSWYYNHCSFVTAPSRSVFTEMEQYNFQRPHEVLSNPIDTDVFVPAKHENDRLAKQKEFGFSDFTVCFAGRLAPEKNIDVIVRAIALVKKKIPHVTFALAGHGTSEQPLKKLAQDLGVQTNLVFSGTLTKEKLAEFYQAANVFAIASTSETQSMVLMQAMAAGLPTIGVNARALPEYIQPENGFVVEVGNYNALAEKIVSVYEYPNKAAQLGQAGRSHALKYSVTAIADRWEALYKSAASTLT